MTIIGSIYIFSWGACAGVVLGAVLVWQAIRVGWIRGPNAERSL